MGSGKPKRKKGKVELIDCPDCGKNHSIKYRCIGIKNKVKTNLEPCPGCREKTIDWNETYPICSKCGWVIQ